MCQRSEKFCTIYIKSFSILKLSFAINLSRFKSYLTINSEICYVIHNLKTFSEQTKRYFMNEVFKKKIYANEFINQVKTSNTIK